MDQFIYLNVKFSEKDDAKSFGCKWDSLTKKWYAPNQEIKKMWNERDVFLAVLNQLTPAKHKKRKHSKQKTSKPTQIESKVIVGKSYLESNDTSCPFD